MRGRAGRKGKDEIGETYLCCRKDDLEDVVELMHADLPQVSSGLTTDKHRIQRALLEVISIKLVNSRESIGDYIKMSLLNAGSSSSSSIIERDEFHSFIATQLGKAIVASSLEPEDGAFVHREMQRALRAFVMDGEMHILYTFTPVQELPMSVNWQAFRSEMEALDESGLRVLTFLGLKPAVINRMSV
jgi:replicative superfamily II helicase